MPSSYSEEKIDRALLTLTSISNTIDQLKDWNSSIDTPESFYESQHGMQLLAANCMLITAIGEGINRINSTLPDFLDSHFPEIPWKAIIGMRNHIAHGYFEIDADIVFSAVKVDIPELAQTIQRAIQTLKTV
jgi:toxin-antitoxin system antitoxin component